MAWFSSSFDVVTMYAGAGGVNEGTSRGNEREGALHGRETSSSPASTCGGEEEAHCRSKQHCFMLSSFFLVFSLLLCGDPKMGYNRCPFFTIFTE
jgi:putative NADPH-quinone reductase